MFAGMFAGMVSAAALQAHPLTSATPAPSPPAMTEVRRLAGLPDAIRADLGAGGRDVISDRGGPFNAGCLAQAGKPNQRFMLAALGADTAVVAVEHGGIAHGAGSREYRRVGGTWRLVSNGVLRLDVAGREDLLAQHARSARPVPASRR